MTNVFDRTSGTTLLTDFNPETSNWVSAFFGLTRHSGTQFFESDNGNVASDVNSLRYYKELGGAIQNTTYHVSFFIAANSLGEGLQPIEFSDFSVLSIGGASGTMNWLQTPTPVPDAGWVEWSGLYTPSTSDIGTPFQFRMRVEISARHSPAISARSRPTPETAVVPEPSTVFLVAIQLGTFVALRRRQRAASHKL